FKCYFLLSSRRRHTSSKRDWSSDVCSSDLSPSTLMSRYGFSFSPSISLGPTNFTYNSGPAQPLRIIFSFAFNRGNTSSNVMFIRSEERRVGKEDEIEMLPWRGGANKKVL